MKVWYWHDKPEEEHLSEDFLKQTREYLLDAASERGVEIMDGEKTHPARLAQQVFSQLIPELKT
jgi:hypothetical protein